MAGSAKFHDLESFTPLDIEAALTRNDPGELALVPITVALLTDDPSAAQELFLRLAAHEHIRVRGHALTGLGHLARRFRVLDEAAVRPVLEAALNDIDEYVRTHARSAADEIHQFLHWEIEGHFYG